MFSYIRVHYIKSKKEFGVLQDIKLFFTIIAISYIQDAKKKL